MSSVLKGKGKKMEPAGYSKIELLKMRDLARNRTTTEALLDEVFKNVRLISYQILCDKFEFTREKIIDFESTTNAFLNAVADKKISIDELGFYIKETYDVDVKAEANKIPFNDRFILTHLKIKANSRQNAGLHILTMVYNYFILAGTVLTQERFGFSKEMVLKFYEWIRFYLNTLTRYKQFDLKISDIAETLAEEIGYCDERFVTLLGNNRETGGSL